MELRPLEKHVVSFSVRRHLRAVTVLIKTDFADVPWDWKHGVAQEARTVAGLALLAGSLVRTSIHDRPLLGYVWLEDGQVIGNVTFHPMHEDRSRWLIEHVGVVQAYRRLGISRLLMWLALREIARRGGDWAVLQVEALNQPARQLYASLGFASVCEDGVWRLPAAAWVPVSPDPAFSFRPLAKARWRERLELAVAARSQLCQWAWPMRRSAYRGSILGRLKTALSHVVGSGRVQEWGVWKNSSLAGAVKVSVGILGSAHSLRFAVKPEVRGTVEGALVARGLRVLQGAPVRPILAMHGCEHAEGVAVLEAVGFRRQHVTVTLRRPVTSADLRLLDLPEDIPPR